MPEFSTSLGCMDAPHVYQGGKVEFTVPVGQNQGRGDHSMDFRGGAVGTITLVQGADDLTEIKYELTVRTDNPELLGPVVLDYPTADEVDSARKSSRVQLATPGIPEGDSACMRFDATVHVPPRVQTLRVWPEVRARRTKTGTVQTRMRIWMTPCLMRSSRAALPLLNPLVPRRSVARAAGASSRESLRFSCRRCSRITSSFAPIVQMV